MRLFPLLLLLLTPGLFGSLVLPEAKTEVVARQGKDQALFIAVEDYANWSDLRYPVKDARRIAAELESHYDFTTEILANPSRKQVLDKLADYRNRNFAPDGQPRLLQSLHCTSGRAQNTQYPYLPNELKEYPPPNATPDPPH